MAELPTGTVTFLFTDIEGSTRLLQELGDEYAAALGEHRRVLRAAFGRHGGVEVDTQGDAFFVAFARAKDALAAAADAQAALEGPVRVRIGLHTGEPLLTDESYVGIDVHRAARIAAAGHGGQVLVSQSTVDATGTDGLQDLGQHRLKDLTTPERLYQLGEGDFPPLKTLYQTNLPAQPTLLVGREREIAEVIDLARAYRLVTLTGAGGSGKTRLALQAAAELVDDFDHGVWFVSLAALTDPSLVEPTIASVVGAKDELADFLTGKRMLLVLDNLEQLLPDVAEVVARLEAHVLATSRERLKVYGEREYNVPTLPSDEAVALFSDRARLIVPTFEPDEQVHAIVQRLDGLPLALELAAARVKVLTTEQILARLGDMVQLLTTGSRDAPARQQTLRATIEWSYQLLTDEEKQLFARLGAFAASFDLEAAEAVASTDIDTLASLVDKSLLRHTEEGRYFMLTTIREYAAERLDADDGPKIRARHADYAIERAAQPPPQERAQWRASLARDYAEFRAALTWLRDTDHMERFTTLVSRLAPFWNAQDQLTEGRAWLTEIFATSDEITVERATARDHFVQMILRQGDLESARAENDRVQTEAVALADVSLLAHAKASRGALEYTARNLSEATAESEASVALFTQIGDVLFAGVIKHDLGLMALTTGDAPRARALFEEAHVAGAEHGHERLEAGALGSLGYVALAEGRLTEVVEKIQGALRIYTRMSEAGLAAATDLYALAAAISIGGEVSAAYALVAALDAYFDEVGAVREPLPERAREQAVATAKAQLATADAEAAWSRGCAMSLDDVVQFALAQRAVD